MRIVLAACLSLLLLPLSMARPAPDGCDTAPVAAAIDTPIGRTYYATPSGQLWSETNGYDGLQEADCEVRDDQGVLLEYVDADHRYA